VESGGTLEHIGTSVATARCGVVWCGSSVKVGGVPQCSGEVEHCGTPGTPALFQSSVE